MFSFIYTVNKNTSVICIIYEIGERYWEQIEDP